MPKTCNGCKDLRLPQSLHRARNNGLTGMVRLIKNVPSKIAIYQRLKKFRQNVQGSGDKTWNFLQWPTDRRTDRCTSGRTLPSTPSPCFAMLHVRGQKVYTVYLVWRDHKNIDPLNYLTITFSSIHKLMSSHPKLDVHFVFVVTILFFITCNRMLTSLLHHFVRDLEEKSLIRRIAVQFLS